MKPVIIADITSDPKYSSNSLNDRNTLVYLFIFLTNANNLAQIVVQKTNTAVCFKGKRSNSGVPGKETK